MVLVDLALRKTVLTTIHAQKMSDVTLQLASATGILLMVCPVMIRIRAQ
jgi:hypothetical protein